jgi:hypothetical protein
MAWKEGTVQPPSRKLGTRRDQGNSGNPAEIPVFFAPTVVQAALTSTFILL